MSRFLGISFRAYLSDSPQCPGSFAQSKQRNSTQAK
jgi:hypothetical protein